MSPTQGPGHGRKLATPGQYSADDGAPDLAIRHSRDHLDLVEALVSGRVLVAVVAVAEEVAEVKGIGVDKSSHMSVVSMIAHDGRRGLLAFTGVDALRAWNPAARPVPVSGVDAARAAIDDDCEAIVLDVAGPRTLVVPEVDILRLAGRDPIGHARDLAQRMLTARFGDERIDVSREGERLHVWAGDEGVQAEDLASAITPRVLALVPAGIEVRTTSRAVDPH